MKGYHGCIPCMLRQAVHAVLMAVNDETDRPRVLKEVANAVRQIDLSQPPPVMGQRIHRIVREMAGVSDPYREIKDRLNRAALDFYPSLKARIKGAARPMEEAVRLAIAGNLLDCGVNTEMDEEHVQPVVEWAFKQSLLGDPGELAEAAWSSKAILFLADNAGEIVFDRLLIDLLPREKVAVAVCGAPVLNDATLADAEQAGITSQFEVIENGSDAPGTILDDCSEAFQERFHAADLVIAKGQGNYETLSEAKKNIYFLLKVKCPVIARDIGRNVGDMVLQRTAASGTHQKGGDGNAGI